MVILISFIFTSIPLCVYGYLRKIVRSYAKLEPIIINLIFSPSFIKRALFFHRRLLERSVELIEFSFDINLTGNALRLHLPLADTPSSLTVNEQSSSHVTILFNNGNAVYRLILPHPLEISKVR